MSTKYYPTWCVRESYAEMPPSTRKYHPQTGAVRGAELEMSSASEQEALGTGEAGLSFDLRCGHFSQICETIGH